MIRKSILAITVVGFAIPYLLWGACNRLADKFHISPFDLQLRLIEAIHNDRGENLMVVRFFHNKVVGFGMDIYRQYLYFWDVKFLLYILSFVGLFGLVYGVWFFFRHKIGDKRLWVLFIVLLVMPLVELLVKINIPLPVHMFALFLPSYLFSLLGIKWFLDGKSKRFRVITLILLALISIAWMVFFAENFVEYCLS